MRGPTSTKSQRSSGPAAVRPPRHLPHLGSQVDSASVGAAETAVRPLRTEEPRGVRDDAERRAGGTVQVPSAALRSASPTGTVRLAEPGRRRVRPHRRQRACAITHRRRLHARCPLRGEHVGDRLVGGAGVTTHGTATGLFASLTTASLAGARVAVHARWLRRREAVMPDHGGRQPGPCRRVGKHRTSEH